MPVKQRETSSDARSTPPTNLLGRILVIDDDPSICDMLDNILSAEGYEVELAGGGAEGIDKILADHYDVVITDLAMPDVDGLAVLNHLQAQSDRTLGILATGYGSVESAVKALKAGAFDYITKPFHIEEIKILMRKAREYQSLRNENQSLRRKLETSDDVEALIGESEQITHLTQLIRTVAESESTVLILGESGTGKELVAKAIHAHSHRAAHKWIPVNCAAIPGELLESELFGHAKGAFTGASHKHEGKFQAADGGTLFLDEIGDMPLRLQSKLLRVLEDKKVQPVGSNDLIPVDVRIVTATHQDLEDYVQKGDFRKDLYYRLNVVPIEIPPLRKRTEDIPLLLEHFAEKAARHTDHPMIRFSINAARRLTDYHWPGNVRELENLVQRLNILYPGKLLEIEDLPEKFERRRNRGSQPSLSIPEDGIDFYELVDQFERKLIEQALQKSGGVKNKAAKLLGLKRTTLVEKMKKKGMMDSGGKSNNGD